MFCDVIFLLLFFLHQVGTFVLQNCVCVDIIILVVIMQIVNLKMSNKYFGIFPLTRLPTDAASTTSLNSFISTTKRTLYYYGYCWRDMPLRVKSGGSRENGIETIDSWDNGKVPTFLWHRYQRFTFYPFLRIYNCACTCCKLW